MAGENNGSNKIEIDLMAKVVADAIWNTGDYGGELLNKKCTSEYPTMRSRESILREYMYLKAGIASGLVYEAVANEQEYNAIMDKALGILKDAYSTAPPSAHGGKYSVLVERLNEYLRARNWDKVTSIFSKYLYIIITAAGGSNRLVNKLASPEFVEIVVSSMREKFIPFQKNNSSGSSKGGCLPVVACISILIVVLLAFACI